MLFRGCQIHRIRSSLIQREFRQRFQVHSRELIFQPAASFSKTTCVSPTFATEYNQILRLIRITF